MNQRIYLDNNASTALDPQVLEAMHESLISDFGNPSSIHSFGQSSRAKLVNSRHAIAAYLKVKPEEIIFTSGGTEGVNFLIHGMLEKHNGHVITSNVEHACIYNSLKHFEKNGATISWIPVGKAGAVDPNTIQEAIRPDTRFIILAAANSETGVKHPIESIAAIAHERGIPFFVDGVALLGKEEVNLYPGITAICFSGHKLHGPKGIGFVWLKKGFVIPNLIMGGPQEFGKRGGTENLPGIVGLAKAVEVLSNLSNTSMRTLRDKLEMEIQAQLPGVHVNGESQRVCNVANLSFDGIEGESLVALLDREGLAVSHGSACSSGAREPSRVLLNMGISPERAESAIRFSLSRFTTEKEIDQAIAIVTRLVTHLRNLTKPRNAT